MKNITIILFGATGDLSKRKIIPALYRFVAHKKLENFIIVGAAFDDVTADQMINAARPFVQSGDEDVWNTLRMNSYYKKINFTEKDDYEELNAFVQKCESSHRALEESPSTSSGRAQEIDRKIELCKYNRLFYLATGSQFFCPITYHIARIGLLQRKEVRDAAWHRIVYEKPFGHDVKSAHEINECIKNTINESQVYRIDHYLTKEVVSNIAMIRFTNCVLEPLWSNRYIDQVQIILSESGGIEGRGMYYDTAGALRDVVQNHMLEMLALVCMESPEKLTGDYIRAERVKVLEKVRFVDGILGQYNGYASEKHVNPDSCTDTYASLKLAVDTPRWLGVPFYLKTGKCLNKKETIIHIKFKQVDCLLMRGCPMDSNWLTIQIAPEAIFLLTLNAKVPGQAEQVMPVGMEFCHSCLYGLQTPEAYEVLLEEIMRGEQSISVRFDEIEYAWKVIDVIEAQKLPVYQYAQGSTGPQEEKQHMEKHGMRWRT
ncbi:MAG TPA: glucose-6-phosphate dehydrogenase [Candidatus Babeliales bacterium]|nr:glucose-6-phosphate dehydrogenase [Candidatus Babeliales bacterium]